MESDNLSELRQQMLRRLFELLQVRSPHPLVCDLFVATSLDRTSYTHQRPRCSRPAPWSEKLLTASLMVAGSRWRCPPGHCGANLPKQHGRRFASSKGLASRQIAYEPSFAVLAKGVSWWKRLKQFIMLALTFAHACNYASNIFQYLSQVEIPDPDLCHVPFDHRFYSRLPFIHHGHVFMSLRLEFPACWQQAIAWTRHQGRTQVPRQHQDPAGSS